MMYFYCARLAYDELQNTVLPSKREEGYNLFTWHVLLLPIKEFGLLCFSNDASGLTIIFKYEVEDDIQVDYDLFKHELYKMMIQMDYPEGLVQTYLRMFSEINVSYHFDEDHIFEIKDFMMKSRIDFFHNFDKNVCVQDKASTILNNAKLGKWFGRDIDKTPQAEMLYLIQQLFK
ncbi:MAG: hypothetical protein UMR38_06420 [Candidatus Izemoplasma sp.]|nr:hypothetical protein [Candidatus Izemoplasma sp.]